MRVPLFLLRICLIGGGFLAVALFMIVDVGFDGMLIFPLWAYAAAHLAILAGLFKREALWRLALALPVFAVTIPMTRSGMSSLAHRVARIQPGMDVAEVRRIMEGFTGGTGLTDPVTREEFVPASALVLGPGLNVPPAPEEAPETRCAIFRDPRHSEAHRAWGVVNFRGGRVVNARVDPD